VSVAKNYAKALFEVLAEEKNGASTNFELARQQLVLVESAVESSSELKMVLYGPVVSAQDKSAIISSICDHIGTLSVVKNVLGVVARKGRMSILGDIILAFDKARYEAEGAASGKVVSADELSDAELDSIRNSFESKLGTKVYLEYEVDKNLLAGLSVTLGGKTYDGSLRSQLDRIQKTFLDGAAAASS